MSGNQDPLRAELAQARHTLQITQSRIAELEAALGEERPTPMTWVDNAVYRYTLDHMLEGAQILGFDWRYLYVNYTAANYGRMARETMIGHTVMERFPGFEQTDMYHVLHECMQKRIAKDAEFEFVFPEGRVAWFEFRIQPIPEGLFILSLDITERKHAESVTRESEERLRLFVEHAPAAIAMLDKDMKYLLVSQRWQTNYRLTDQNIVGRSHYEVFPEISEDWRAIHRRCLAGAIESRDVDAFPRADGTLDWVRWEIRPWRDRDGAIGGIFIFSELITERIQAQEALRENEAHYRLLADNIADVVWVLDLATQRFTYVSPSVETLRGYTPAEVLAQPIDQVMTPDSLALIGNSLPARIQAFLAGDPKAVTQTHEIEQTRRDGSTVWTEVVTRLMRDSSGAIQALGVTRDISERRRLEAELREREEWMRLSMQASDLGMWWYEIEKGLLHFDERARLQYGFDTDTVTTQQFFAHIHPNDIDRLTHDLAQALDSSGDGKYQVEYRIHQPDGTYRWLAILAKVYRFERAGDTHIPVLAFGTSWDMTERKQAEEALRVSEERYRRVVEDQTDAICRYDLDFRLTFVNHAYSALYGKTPSDMLGLSILDMIPVEQRAAARTNILSLTAANPVATSEHQSIMPDQTVRWFQWTDRALLDKDGRIVEYQGVGRDITERKAAEEALQEAHELLEQKVIERTTELQATKDRVEAILNNSLDSIVLVDMDFNIQRANTAFSLMFMHETDPMPILDCIDSADRERVEATLRAALNTSMGKHTEARCRRPDGSTFDAELSIGHIKDDGLVCTLRDITERKRTQTALAEERSLLRTLIDAIPDFIYVKDLNHRTLLSNVARAKFHGMTPEEMIGTDDFALCPPELAAQYRADEVRLFQTGEPLIDHEEHIVSSDHSRAMWGSTTKVPLRNLHGELIGLAGITLDITERKERERQLRYHASLQENISDAVIATDMDFRIQSWNKAAERIYGWRADEAIGRTGPELFQTQFLSGQDRDQIVQGFLSQGWWQSEVTQRRKDGTEIHILGTMNLLKNEAGQPFGIVAVNHDITERKRAEDELRRRERWYRTLADNLPKTTVFMFDQDCRYLIVEGEAPTLPKEVMEGKTVQELFPAEAAASLLPGYEAALRGETYSMERVANGRTYDGQFVPIHDDDGAISAGLLMVRDVTDERSAEQNLRESEARFRRLIEAAPIAILITDEDGRIVLVNEQTGRLFGYDNDELIGQSVDVLVPERLREQHGEHRQGYIAAPHVRRMGSGLELFAIHKDGSEIPVEIELGYIETHEGLLVVSFVLDIKERKQAEIRLRQALAKEKELGELKTRFVSMASHEFRNPLATILAATETLTVYRPKLTEAQIEQRLTKIREQVDHLRGIMEDVLQLARMQARRVEFNPTVVDVDGMLRSVLDEIQNQPDQTSQIVYTCAKGLPTMLLDRKLMRQIVSNLVGNALKYSPDGKPVIVSADYINDQLTLVIADQGIGIPEADLEHLFEPFHRAANVGTISGTGLGLVITKESVELHGGAIAIASRVGEGTTITVSIPGTTKTSNPTLSA